MSTYSGTRLLEPASKALSDSGDSDTIRPGSSDPHDSDYYSFMSDTEFYGHPDCEPHLVRVSMFNFEYSSNFRP